MLLAYTDLDGTTHRTRAKITTDHSASSYGVPVIVLPDGGLIDATSWALLAYHVVKATPAERAMLARWMDQINFLMQA